MIKKILALCCMVFQLQATNIFQAVEVNDKLAVRQWLKSKPSVELLNEQGKSLLHVAVQAGNRTLVKNLLKKKIDVNLIDQFGKTAMDYAVELRYKNICYDLLGYKASVTQEVNWLILNDMLKRYSVCSFIGKAFLIGLSVLFIGFTLLGGLFICAAGPTSLLTIFGLPFYLLFACPDIFAPPLFLGIGLYAAGKRKKALHENIAVIR